MLRDVKHHITDKNLGFATATGDGRHLKIGVSPVVSDTPIIVTGAMDAAQIKSRLGLSPLADAVMDSVQFGANRIYCLPVSATTAGSLGIVSKTVTPPLPSPVLETIPKLPAVVAETGRQ